MDAGGALLLLGLIGLLVFWIFQGKSSLDHFPHRTGWPIIGNLPQIRTDRPELTLTEWRKDLGDVFAVKMMNTSMLILNSYEAIYEALVKRGDQFAGRPQVNAFRLGYITNNFQDLAFSNPNARWKLLRKVSHKSIKMFDTGMKRIEEINLNVIDSMLDEFEVKRGESFNPKEIIYNSIMNIMTTLLLNQKYSKDDELFKNFVEIERTGLEVMSPGGKGVELDIFPWLRYFGNSTFKTLLELVKKQDRLWDLIKKDAQASSVDGLGVCNGLVGDLFREHYLRSKESLDASDVKLEELHLKLTTIDMIAAGTSTTSNSVYSFFNILIHHPKVQAKLRAEVDRIVGPGRHVSLDDRKDMPYTQATIYELLRYTSLVPFGLPHVTLTETSICGKPVPAGVQVLLNLWALHHDEDFWDAPYEFCPERFLDDDGQLVSASHDNRRHLMSFGAGPRVCIGEILALGRLFLLIASVVQKFEMKQGLKKASCDAKDYKHGLVLTSDDYEVVLQMRSVLNE